MKTKIKLAWKNFVHFLKMRDFQWKFKLIVVLPLFFGLLFIDVLSKTLCHNYLEYNKEIDFMPGFINIHLTYNMGAAFGLNSDKPALVITCSIILSFFILLAIIFLTQKSILIGLTMMFTGALGNLIDRTWNPQGVVDFFSWKLFPPASIFNFADMCVVFGLIELVCSITYTLIKEFLLERKETKEEEKKEQIKNQDEDNNKDKEEKEENGQDQAN